MSREEAIKWLRLDIDMMKFDPSTGEDAYLNDDAWHVIEAQEMAIDALKQPECEDAVSRTEAVRVASGYCHPANVADEIAKLPSVTPKRKKGKWVPENRTIDAFWVCSACGFPSEACGANVLYKFCPNCGARMTETCN